MIPFATITNAQVGHVVRCGWQGFTDLYDQESKFQIGKPLYCGSGAKAGLYVATGTHTVGICRHVPTQEDPRLGVASLL